MAWFKGVFASILAKLAPGMGSVVKWVLYLILGWIWEKIALPLWTRYQAEKEARIIAEENLKKYREAVERGDEDEIGRIGSDILNGRRR